MEKDWSNSVGIVESLKMEVVSRDKPLMLECGKEIAPVEVAYESYGRLNEAKDNVILVCHALSGDAHAAGYHSKADKKPGWWEDMIGPGKWIDTDKYFVICSNFLGGCSGTTGPSSIDPETGRPYGLSFPIITVNDMVKVQKLLVEKLGISQLLCVIGGSMGGMGVLSWAINYPDMVNSAVVIASTARLSAQSIAFDAVGRNAILADAGFADGQYYDKQIPSQGLAIARMIGHITYLSEEGMRSKFGRTLRESSDYGYDLKSEFSVETYLDYQGQRFVERFDANSYLYITKAMDYFDLVRDYGGLKKAFENIQSKMLIVSFSSDWLFTPAQSREMVDALVGSNKQVSYCNIESSYGHDAFLLETESLGRLVGGFIANVSGKTYDSCPTGEKRYPDSIGGIYDRAKRVRVDHDLIASLIEADSRVLDVGCGDGELMIKLIREKNVRAEGIEIDQDLVISAVEKGISLIHCDIEEVKAYGDESFDYVILSQTVQTLRSPDKVFRQLLRIGRKVIVSFPNFAYWKSRLQLSLLGRAPITAQLPFSWYDSPNIHFLSIKDFDQFCAAFNVCVDRKITIVKDRVRNTNILPNFFAEQAVYVTSKKQ